MALDKEKSMIKDGLKKLSERENFEKLLNNPPTLYQSVCSVPKNDLTAKHFRVLGNELYQQRIHDVCIHYNIIKNYNRSIAAAPLNSESLALAHGNRSAIFEHIGKCEESIAAIDKALQISASPSLKVKLLCHKAKCKVLLGLSDGNECVQQAKLWLGELDGEPLLKKTLANYICQAEMLVKEGIQNPIRSENINVANSGLDHEVQCGESVEIAFSNEYGQHLIASQDIKPGEILMIENTVNSPPGAEQMFLYCWHCSSFLWNAIPCDYCLTCCFCSEQCKMKSWEQYHEIECKIQPAIAIIYPHLQTCEPRESPLLNQLGLRIFMIALKQAGSVENLRAVLEAFDESEDPDWVKDLEDNDYRHVYALSANVTEDDLNALVADTTLNLVILARYTSIFKEVLDPQNFTMDKLMNNDDILHMAAVLLKFCAVCDTHALDNFRGYDCMKENACTVGCGLLSWSLGRKTSLARRNCIPNSRKCMIKSNKMILYSIRPIEKGAQIIDSDSCLKYCHMSIFDNTPKSARQMAFRERYGFSCNCQACEEDWPSFNFESNLNEYYSKVAPFLSHKNLEMMKNFLRMSETNSELPLTERKSGFSKLIQCSLEESPLPSKSTAFIIRGFIVFMELAYGFSNKPQVGHNCHALIWNI